MLDGHYFLPNSSRVVPARCGISNGVLSIYGAGGEQLDQAPVGKASVLPRLGSIPRRIGLPGGGRFEAADNDVSEEFLEQNLRFHQKSWSHRLERSGRWAIGALLFSALIVYGFVVYGIPLAARKLANATPLSVDAVISRDALPTLDAIAFSRSRLGRGEKEHILRLFSAIAAKGQRGKDGYRLVFRASPRIGANAFALPDGTVVLTDELWRMVKDDGEIQGVFAHEITHVDRRHSLQRLYQASFIPALITVVTGDFSQASQLAVILPSILMQASYSQGMEQEADDQAGTILRSMKISPSHLADLLERMDKQVCKDSDCPPNWLGSHPDTSVRASKLRNGH